MKLTPVMRLIAENIVRRFWVHNYILAGFQMDEPAPIKSITAIFIIKIYNLVIFQM